MGHLSFLLNLVVMPMTTHFCVADLLYPTGTPTNEEPPPPVQRLGPSPPIQHSPLTVATPPCQASECILASVSRTQEYHPVVFMWTDTRPNWMRRSRHKGYCCGQLSRRDCTGDLEITWRSALPCSVTLSVEYAVCVCQSVLLEHQPKQTF